MSYELRLQDIDVDGAVRETAAEAMQALDGDTRSEFLRRAGIAGGAFMGGGALLGALAPSALAANTYDRPPAKFGKGDIGILNYALTLEYLESTFYNEAHIPNATALTKGFLKIVRADEAAHVKFLTTALGAKAIRKPRFNFHGTNKHVGEFVATATLLENTGVMAYSGQSTNLKSAANVHAAVSILTVEARHAALIGGLKNGEVKGTSPNGAFDTAAGAAEVLAAVKKTRFIAG
jgi:hypothetical protein